MAAPTPPALETRILDWLDEIGTPCVALESLTGDVSQRRYFRAAIDRGSAVCAAYPASLQEAFEAFLTTSQWLQTAGITVPEVLAFDRNRRLMLLEDVGAETLYSAVLETAEREAYVELAIRLAHRIADLAPGEVMALHAPIDGVLMERELAQTWRLVLDPLLAGQSRLAECLASALDVLVQRLSSAPRTPAHRDFMSRNLVPRNGSLVVLDHQDLRMAPAHYDLASLLFDSQRLALDRRRELWEGSVPSADREQAQRAVVQRTLKIAGTFRAFAARGNDLYLKNVPEALSTAFRYLDGLPEGAGLGRELNALLAAEPAR